MQRLGPEASLHAASHRARSIFARGRRVGAGLAALAAVAVFAGCGGSSGGSTSTTTSSIAAASSAATRTAAGSTSSAASTSTSSSTTASEPATTTVRESGKILLPSGPMHIGSPAFALGGAIPVRYTCNGANLSPALQWGRVPAGAAELFLFVLDENGNPPQGGIRWVVGGISPTSQGIAAGATPAGAVVGRNSAGQASWGGICPTDKRPHTIVFVLYALHKKLGLSSGFVPAEAERHFAGNTFASAETYGTYQRR
jgi:Raf kinase inhibitor-like YbhB/YbcL family protein